MKGIIEQFGGSWNGYTWIDQTTYLETATADALDRMLFIEASGWPAASTIPTTASPNAPSILAELDGGDNDPEQVLDNEVTAARSRPHGYHHPTIGWPSDLKTMSRDDLYGFYRRWAVPNNATLVVVGDVDADDALRRIERQFGSISPGSLPGRIATREPEQLGSGGCASSGRARQRI